MYYRGDMVIRGDSRADKHLEQGLHTWLNGKLFKILLLLVNDSDTNTAQLMTFLYCHLTELASDSQLYLAANLGKTQSRVWES